MPIDSETLTLRRIIPAPCNRVFNAWTNADEVKQWWGPQGVECLSVQIDLQVGGQYRIDNKLPDGSVLTIGGEFELIEAPHKLVYTWIVETAAPTKERVTVQFAEHRDGTEVQLTHEMISTAEILQQHLAGWHGCLDGLGEFTRS